MGFRDDPSTGYEGQTQKSLIMSTVEGGKRITSQQNTSSTNEGDEVGASLYYCSKVDPAKDKQICTRCD